MTRSTRSARAARRDRVDHAAMPGRGCPLYLTEAPGVGRAPRHRSPDPPALPVRGSPARWWHLGRSVRRHLVRLGDSPDRPRSGFVQQQDVGAPWRGCGDHDRHCSRPTTCGSCRPVGSTVRPIERLLNGLPVAPHGSGATGSTGRSTRHTASRTDTGTAPAPRGAGARNPPAATGRNDRPGPRDLRGPADQRLQSTRARSRVVLRIVLAQQ
jgi:hypothetical protein